MTYAGKAFRDQRRAFIGWMLALAGVALMYGAFYPSIRDSAADLQAYMDKLPEAVKNIIGTEYTSPRGYLRGELFGSLGILLMLVYAIGAGARAIAGEEESRTLDLLLSTPLRRAQVLRDKAIAAGVVCFGLAAGLFVVVAVAGPPFDLNVALADLANGCLMLALTAIAFGAIALAVGAATGRRVAANATAGAVAVVSLIVNALAPTVTALEPLRPLSLFRWYLEPDPLTAGFQLQNVLVLVAVAVVAYAIAHVTLTRRILPPSPSWPRATGATSRRRTAGGGHRAPRTT